MQKLQATHLLPAVLTRSPVPSYPIMVFTHGILPSLRLSHLFGSEVAFHRCVVATHWGYSKHWGLYSKLGWPRILKALGRSPHASFLQKTFSSSQEGIWSTMSTHSLMGCELIGPLKPGWLKVIVERTANYSIIVIIIMVTAISDIHIVVMSVNIIATVFSYDPYHCLLLPLDNPTYIPIVPNLNTSFWPTP